MTIQASNHDFSVKLTMETPLFNTRPSNKSKKSKNPMQYN